MFDCSACKKNPQLKEQLGCEKPLKTGYVFEEPWNDTKLRMCPRKFIPDCVFEFLMIERFNNVQNAQRNDWHNTSARYSDYKMRYLEYVDYSERYKAAIMGN